MRGYCLVVMALLTAYSCTTRDSVSQPGQAEGYAPVYASLKEVAEISIEPSKATSVPGKIYATANYIFQNDVNSGIHIISNADRSHPVKLAFLKVPFSTEIAVKGNFLYTNNVFDLVVFDISDPRKPSLVKRVEKVFPVVNQRYPPFSNTQYECPNPDNGIVVRWERKMLTSPKCRR